MNQFVAVHTHEWGSTVYPSMQKKTVAIESEK